MLPYLKKKVEINLGDRLPLKTFQELDYRDFKLDSSNSDGLRRVRNKRQTSIVDAPFLQTNRLYFSAFSK